MAAEIMCWSKPILPTFKLCLGQGVGWCSPPSAVSPLNTSLAAGEPDIGEGVEPTIELIPQTPHVLRVMPHRCLSRPQPHCISSSFCASCTRPLLCVCRFSFGGRGTVSVALLPERCKGTVAHSQLLPDGEGRAPACDRNGGTALSNKGCVREDPSTPMASRVMGVAVVHPPRPSPLHPRLDVLCTPPPPCASTALSEHGVGVEPLVLGIFGTTVFVVPDVTWGLKSFYHTLPRTGVCFDVILRHS